MIGQNQLLKSRVEHPSKDMTPVIESTGLRARNPEELVELFSDDIWRYVSSQVPRREDAEDIVMEVFSVAIDKFHKVKCVDNQRHWLLAVARNKTIDCMRRHYRRLERSLEACDAVTVSEGISERQEATRIALRALPFEQGQAMVLKYVNGLSTEEVARVIKKSASATNSLLQRARVALRTALSPVFPQEVIK
jgi:RNA polymerase sigma-70 factor (ECF subfamily)